MTDIKKINIYMGVVGQAYVDKETAKKQMDAAAKNVVDVKHIIYLIDHSYADEFAILNDNDNYPLTMQSYEEIAQTTLNNATAASQLASTVKQNIQNALNGFSDQDQQYKELQALLNKLAENDIDGIYENGGNTILAEANVTRINAFITELAEIKNIAQDLLAENQNYYDECVVAFNNAKEIFESYVPEAAEDQASKSDRLEAELIARLNVVAAGLETAQATTDAINQTSNDVMDEANEIIQSGGGEPVNPQPVDNGNYYFGIATEDQVQNQSYINGLGYNIAGEKPATINFEEGFNVLIVPASWGTPIVKDPNGFTYSEFGLNELGITNPEGKIVLVYSSGQIEVTLEWN